MRVSKKAIGALVAMVVATPAWASPSDALHRIFADYWSSVLDGNPIYASTLGVHTHDDELGDWSLEARDKEAASAGQFIKRLDAVPSDALPFDDRTNKAILRRMLSEEIEDNGFGERMINVTTFGSWFQSIAMLPDELPFHRKADFESYLARLGQYPRANAQELDIARRAIAGGYVQPCATLGGLEASVTGVISDDPEQSRFYGPFRGQRPADTSETEWSAMQARAKAIITGTLNPEYRKTADFLRTDYLPKCRATIGVTALPDGQRYYALLVREETTTDLTPSQIHQIGLDEVARIRGEMDRLAVKAGYKDRASFIHTLRTDPRFYPKSASELLGAAALDAKTLEGKVPAVIGKLPRATYGVREVPADTAPGSPTAYYMSGSPEAGVAGTFNVNTSQLDQRPLYELPALTAHEAVPGHHIQVSLQQEMDLPDFRKNLAHFTAFTEGWGLYAEHLGIELGVYDTPEKDMGRLSYEMWRACRLVVDTGLHAQGWSKAQAIAYMKDNTALTDANIEAEVNRYITHPGQALAYKIGELRLLALRQKAETALGPKFDVRRFHDAVLAGGSVPLDVLNSEVDNWIAAEQKRPGSHA